MEIKKKILLLILKTKFHLDGNYYKRITIYDDNGNKKYKYYYDKESFNKDIQRYKDINAEIITGFNFTDNSIKELKNIINDLNEFYRYLNNNKKLSKFTKKELRKLIKEKLQEYKETIKKNLKENYPN